MRRGSPFRVRASLSAAASVEIVASASGARWSLRSAIIGWKNATLSTTIDFYESGTHLFGFGVQTTAGSMRWDFDGEEWIASDTNTGLSMNTDSGGTVTGLFIGSTRS